MNDMKWYEMKSPEDKKVDLKFKMRFTHFVQMCKDRNSELEHPIRMSEYSSCKGHYIMITFFKDQMNYMNIIYSTFIGNPYTIFISGRDVISAGGPTEFCLDKFSTKEDVEHAEWYALNWIGR
jgi:hypothetical protein